MSEKIAAALKVVEESTERAEQAAAVQPQVEEIGCDADLAVNIRNRREALGLSRSALGSLTGLSGSRSWAVEQEAGVRVTQATYAQVAAALDKLERDGLPEHLRKTARHPVPRAMQVTRADLQRRLVGVTELLHEALQAKTMRDTKAAVERARALITGTEADTINLPGQQDAPAASEGDA